MPRGASALLILLLSSACVLATEPSVDLDASRQQILKLVAEPLTDGAAPKHAASFYSSENLYEYMDGAADIFVLYGVRQMLHLDLRVNAADVTLDVFDMGAPDAAFGMYASERSPDF